MTDPMLLTAEQLESAVQKPGLRPDWYMILKYWAPSRRWSIQGPYLNRDRAQAQAEQLDPGWTHWRILRVPGEAI